MAADAHVAIERVDAVLARARGGRDAWMSPSELARLPSLRSAPRLAHYIAGHWLARALLAHAFGGAAEAWRLRERRDLPPDVEDHPDLCVSISHSGDWIAAAVAAMPIGIDVEQRPRPLSQGIACLLTEPGEAPGSLDDDTLLQRWVAKEAWIKRDAGSALPHELARLRLRPMAPERADVVIDSHPSFHLAIALAPGARMRRHGEATQAAGQAFAVTRIDPAVAPA